MVERNKNGVERYTTGIVANEMKMLGGGQAREQSSSNQRKSQSRSQPNQQSVSDDDIPF